MNALELIVSSWFLNDTMEGSYDRAANSRWRNHRPGANNGLMVHTIVAQDGSWTEGAAQHGRSVRGVTFDKPGSYAYICKDHP
jgi:hypothetical protein